MFIFVSKREGGEGEREVVGGVVEVVAKGKVEKRGREMIHWMFEVLAYIKEKRKRERKKERKNERMKE